MAEAGVYARILDHANRADPYPLYAELRKTPVLRREDGTWVVSTYQHIAALLHDPRLSSDLRPPEERVPDGPKPSFLRLDPPDHDRIRRLTMRHFGPPHTPGRVDGMYDELGRTVAGLVDGFAGRHRVDVVDDYAYPFPVAVICRLLGVPPEDEPRFRQWVDVLVNTLDPTGDDRGPGPGEGPGRPRLPAVPRRPRDAHRASPGDDMLSALATDDGPEGRLPDEELVGTAMLLLIAGHETTVNLIANGVLTLLRNPDVLQRLRADPDLVVRLVEELLRFEPSVQIIPWRKALDDIVLGGHHHPEGRHRLPRARGREPGPRPVPGPGPLRPRPQGPAPELRRRAAHLLRGAVGAARDPARADRVRPSGPEPAAGGRPAAVPARHRCCGVRCTCSSTTTTWRRRERRAWWSSGGRRRRTCAPGGDRGAVAPQSPGCDGQERSNDATSMTNR